jgi:hypothetical protein
VLPNSIYKVRYWLQQPFCRWVQETVFESRQQKVTLWYNRNFQISQKVEKYQHLRITRVCTATLASLPLSSKKLQPLIN